MSSTFERGFALFSVFLLVILSAVVVVGVVAFDKIAHANPLNPAFYESTPPKISWINEPAGLGADPVQFKADVSDTGGGLDEVIVRISQKNHPQELARRTFDSSGVRDDEVTFKIDPKALALREGNVELQILAFDKTLWSNAATLTKTLRVDFLRPRIDVITPEQNAVIGGAEVVFYKVVGKKPVTQGVAYENTIYPGYPARFLDESFKSYDTLYFSFFPLPLDFDESVKLKLMARDDIGNIATSPFNYRVRHKRGSVVRIQLDDKGATRLRDTLAAFAHAASIEVALPGDVSSDLRSLLHTLHLQDEGILAEVLGKTDEKRWWKGPFGRPAPNYPTSTMGDQRVIMINDQEIAKESLSGARFAYSSQGNVLAANAGRVAFTGTLGLLGETIAIDHGFGLATIYGHLSQISVHSGDQVTTGTVIGRSGTSGLSQSEEVYFEVRLHNVPVSPNEWWDPTWVKDHIENKIGFVQRTLIGNPGE